MYTSFEQVKREIENGKTVEDITRNYLETIKEKESLNAFLEVFDQDAIEQAQKVDKKLKNNTAGKLAGMVIGLKDNICYKGHAVSASSKILENFESLYSATVVERLLEEDAVIIGRLNCDEFAMGSSNEHSAYGAVKNPHDQNRVPGGSSGGSAAAVAAGLCLATLGSDTGGSIRQPASFCGVVGLKPTYGRVSRWGLIAYGSSLDQIGPLTNSVEDSALILEVIAGSDQKDSTASTKKTNAYSTAPKFDGKAKIAVIKETFETDGLDLEIKKNLEERIDSLKEQGHTVDYVSLDILDKLVPTYYVLSNAEASSNLSRYDGMRYGYRSEQAEDLESTYVKSRTEGFGTEVKRRIMLGTFVLSAGYYDAYYSKAQKVRRIIREKTDEMLRDYDFILSPTTPKTAFEFGANDNDPVSMYLEDIFTVHSNLAGTPAISIPAGFHSNGMPYGLQIMAGSFEEKKLLGFARALTE